MNSKLREELASKLSKESKNAVKVTIKTTKPGDAVHFPKKGDSCSVHYIGTLESGQTFDDSYNRGQPLIFRLGSDQVIPGLEDTIIKMSKGQKCRVIVPPELGYGETGYPPIIPPFATLTYELELISFSSENLTISMQR